jgi:nucleoside-diphosphate-sugar epimerase
VLDLAERGVRCSVVRLPRSVRRQGGPYGFASVLVATAQRTGVSAYVGDGTQRWPAVNHFDTARLYRLVLEQAAPGTVAHAIGDEGDTMRSIAETIGRQLGVPVEPVPPENFGTLGSIFGIDQPSSSALTRKQFSWEPTHPTLLEDLEAGNYPA